MVGGVWCSIGMRAYQAKMAGEERREREEGGRDSLLYCRDAKFCCTKSHHHSTGCAWCGKNTEIAGKKEGEKLAVQWNI